MTKTLLAACVALIASAPADASLLEYGYTFKSGRTIGGMLYGSLSDNGNIFEASGSRVYSTSPYNAVFEGTTAINSVFETGPAQIALDKSLIDLKIQRVYSKDASTAVLFGVGDTPFQQATGRGDVAAFSGFNYEEFDPTKFTVDVLEEATLSFSYRSPLNSAEISGTLAGWVTSDGSRFEVGELVSFNGQAAPEDLFLRSNDGAAPAVWLDKSKVDFHFYSNPEDWYGAGTDFLRFNEGTFSARNSRKASYRCREV
jgi:hypothetical protein